MTTIHKFAYKAVWDASDLTKGLMNSREQFLAHKKIVQDSQTPMERYAIGQKNLATLMEKYPAIVGQRLKLEQDLEKQYLREESALRKLTKAESARLKELNSLRPDAKSLDGQPQGLKKLAVAAGVGGVAGAAAYGAKEVVTSFADKSIEAVRQSERLESAFRTFTKSGEQSAQMMDNLRQMSRRTGVSLGTLASSVEQLLIARFDGGEAFDTMRRLADVTGGNADRMGRLAYAMGQVRDMGRLQAEELGQLREGGFNPLSEILQITGWNADEFRDKMRNGAVTYDLVAAALKRATDEGGRFSGRMDEAAKTIDGAMNKAAVTAELAAERMGKALGPIAVAWANLKADLADTIARADPESTSSLISGIRAGLTQWTDPAKAAGILQKQWESERAHPSNEIGYRSNQLDDQIAPSRNRVLAEEKKRNELRAKEESQAKARAELARAATMPTEKGQAYLKEQQQAIFDLQKQLTGEKDRQLSIDERIVQLRKQLTSDGLNKQEIERAVTLERQRDALKSQVDESERRKRRDEFLKAGAQRGFDAVRGKDESKISAMMDLLMARDLGKINAGEFNKASMGLAATDTGGRRELAPNMLENSQESYKYFAQLQNQSQHAKGDYDKAIMEIQQLQLAAQNRIAEKVGREPEINVLRR